jgi:hypothetical protein
MTTLPDDREMPDEVSPVDYLEQHTGVEPGQDAGDDVDAVDDATTGSDELSTGEGKRVETDRLDLDTEADEGDLLEQATSVPVDDGVDDREE